MEPVSLLKHGKYSLDWVKDFYTQSDIWWGPDAGQEYYPARIQAIERLCGPGRKRILELGAGSGAVAIELAKLGHSVVAVELTSAIQPAQGLHQEDWSGSLIALEADFYTVELDGRFDVICYWDGFGLGSDDDQRRLLQHIAREWLAPGGNVLMDVFSPVRFARHAGESKILPPLEGVPGSVEMLHKCHFDPLHCRWIDEWQPTADSAKALAQTVRCYTPSDFALLLQDTGLIVKHLEVGGEAVDLEAAAITSSGPLMEAYSYLVQLIGTGNL